MMEQYIEIKSANPIRCCSIAWATSRAVLPRREVASRALGITLTKRGEHQGDDIPMCGVPVHAPRYLQKLIALGHRVAVCEQVEDPAEARKRGAKSVVRRDVVRLVAGHHHRGEDPRAGRGQLPDGAGAGEGGAAGRACAGARLDRHLDRRLPRRRDRPTGCSPTYCASAARADPGRAGVPGPGSAAGLRRDPPHRRAAASGAVRWPPPSAHLRFFGVATADSFGRFGRAELAAAAAASPMSKNTQKAQRRLWPSGWTAARHHRPGDARQPGAAARSRAAAKARWLRRSTAPSPEPARGCWPSD